MICNSGDLVLIPFPFSDLTTAKRRPVLVITTPDRYGDFISLAVTSVEQRESAIALTNESLREGALPKPSWVRVDKVFTLSSSNVVKVIGSVRKDVFQSVLTEMCKKVGYVRG